MSESINNTLIHLYHDLWCKDYDLHKNVSSISLGIEDYYQWKSEDNIYRGYVEIDRWNGIEIKVCPNRKRLIKFNLHLTQEQKNRRVWDKKIDKNVLEILKEKIDWNKQL